MLQEHLGTDYEVTSIFKPNAPLANVDEDLTKLGKNLTKRDHVVIVGGPGNSPDRNYHYSIQKDINFIAEYQVLAVFLLSPMQEPLLF
jgi:hypothetical protein